jgi:hypothetical protein
MTAIALLDDEREHAVEAHVDAGGVRLAPEAVERTLGWALRPQGLCRGDVCIPVRDRAALADARGIDLAALAALLDRPLALDPAEAVAALGASAAERGARLRSLEAPDVTLPDLAGNPHALAEYRGRKALLLAWAGW